MVAVSCGWLPSDWDTRQLFQVGPSSTFYEISTNPFCFCYTVYSFSRAMLTCTNQLFALPPWILNFSDVQLCQPLSCRRTKQFYSSEAVCQSFNLLVCGSKHSPPDWPRRAALSHLSCKVAYMQSQGVTKKFSAAILFQQVKIGRTTSCRIRGVFQCWQNLAFYLIQNFMTLETTIEV